MWSLSPGLIIGLLLFSDAFADFDPVEALRQHREAQVEAERLAEEERQRQESEAYQRFLAIASSRYEVASGHSGVVVDRRTRLQWMRCSMGQHWDGQNCTGIPSVLNWPDALLIPDLFNDQGGYAGHADWRIPTLDELQGLVFCSNDQSRTPVLDLEQGCSLDIPYLRPTLVPDLFPQTPRDWFWTATADAAETGYVWALNFSFGHGTHYPQEATFRLRLVRGGR